MRRHAPVLPRAMPQPALVHAFRILHTRRPSRVTPIGDAGVPVDRSAAKNVDTGFNLKGRRNPFVAREGIAYLFASLVLAGIGWRLGGVPYALPFVLVFLWLVLIFRDPKRSIPAQPLGIVSPVDGVVTEVGLSDCGIVAGEVHKIVIRINSLGTYTARSPVEGKIMDLKCDLPAHASTIDPRGLWVRTDEDEDVVLEFHGYRFGLAPRALQGFGERVGQGQRCAYLRLARYAVVQFPLPSRVLVATGQRVTAGTDVLAKLPHH